MNGIAGILEVLANLARVVMRTTEAGEHGIKKTAEEVVEDAQRACPVDTGKLQASIKILGEEDHGKLIKVGTELEYAGFPEYGTIYIDPEPYMRPALHRAEANVMGNVGGSIRGGNSEYEG